MIKRIAKLALVAVLGLAGAAQAAVVYRVSTIPVGDTIGLQGLANNGDMLFTGYGDVCGGKSALYTPGGPERGRFVSGLPSSNISRDIECGVRVTAFNSAGDMIGTSLNEALVRVDTFWRGGVAFDLTDPANAGLTFVADVGTGRVPRFDVSSLTIENPDVFARFGDTPDQKAQRLRDALIALSGQQAFTNLAGQFAFDRPNTIFSSGFLFAPVSTPVSSPATLALVGLGLVGVALSRKKPSTAS
jgi:hypothetical protein